MNGTELSERHVAELGGRAGIGPETARLLASRGAGDDRRPRPGGLAGVVAQLDPGDRVRPVVVDAERLDSLRAFFAAAGPIIDLLVTVTRRGGATPAAELAETDLAGAFSGQAVAHGPRRRPAHATGVASRRSN